MSNVWKSDLKNSTSQPNTTQPSTTSGKTLSSWSRQQKFAMIASAALLGVLLAVSACSKQQAKPALVGVSGPAVASATAAETTPAAPPAAPLPATAKKAAKKRPANVTYRDADSGISFLYPRKFLLTSGDKGPELAALSDVPMNFVQPGGVTIATVTAPAKSYPGTDFASASFTVNVNRNVSQEQCAHFAFVDTRNADGEPLDAEKVQVGESEMEMTSDFAGDAIRQAETQYYHSYENGACYEYVLGLGTEGFGTEGAVKHVDRDKVFARLEKILATVKINPAVTSGEPERVAEKAAAGASTGKE